MPRLRRFIPLGALVLGACCDPTGVSIPGRARLSALDAPSELVFGTPLTVSLTYELGACDRFERVATRRVGTILELEVRNVYELGPNVGGCIDIGPTEHTTTITMSSPPVGTLTVRGLQPEPALPLERQVAVTPQ